MKILLIQPAKPILHKQDGSREGRQAMFPLGLLYIAAAAERAGHVVEVLDVPTEGFATEEFLEELPHGTLMRIGLPMPEVGRRIAAAQPDVVGISCLLSTSADEALKCAAAAKQVAPSIPVVLGGAHPSALPAEMLGDRSVDYVVIGEGEETFVQLLQCLGDGRVPRALDGIGYREQGQPVVRPKTRWIDDLDALAWPARHLVDLRRYVDNYYKFRAQFEYGHTRSMEWGMYTSMLASRGCPYDCSFCAKNVVWGRRYRTRSVASVVDEMEFLVKRHGVKEIHFEDENWAGNPEHAKQICREILRRGLDVAWALPNGITLHTMSEELLRLMRQAGAYSLTLSLESASPRICKRFIHKPIDKDKAVRMIGVIRELGFELFVGFMIGFPGETLAEIQETIRWAESLDVENFGFAIATPLPGTQLLDLCEHEGLLVAGFDRRRLRFSVGNIQTDQFTPALLERLRREEYLRIHRQRAARDA